MVLPIDSDFGSTRAALMTSCTAAGRRLLLQVIWQFLGRLLVRRGGCGFSVDGRFGKGVVGEALGEGGGGVGRVVGGEEEGGGGTITHCRRSATSHLPYG